MDLRLKSLPVGGKDPDFGMAVIAHEGSKLVNEACLVEAESMVTKPLCVKNSGLRAEEVSWKLEADFFWKLIILACR